MVETFRLGPGVAADLRPGLELLGGVCEQVGVPFVVIGAAARDLLLQHVYGVRPFRATTDIDIAVAVRDWEEYRAVLQVLVREHGFEQAGEPHRLRRRDSPQM